MGRHLRRWDGVINRNEFVEVLDISVSVVTRMQVRLGVRFRTGAEFFSAFYSAETGWVLPSLVFTLYQDFPLGFQAVGPKL